MRKWILTIAAAALLVVPVAAEELTLDQIIERHDEALGGLDAWEGVKTARITGKMQMGGGQMEAPFKIMFKRPGKARMEFTLQGMTGVQATDGEIYWMVMPFMGSTDPEVMADDQAKQFQQQAEFESELMHWKEKGHQVELLGKTEVEGTPAYELKVTRKDGDESNVFLDAEYFIPIKVEAKRDIQGTEVEIETTIGDYKEVGDGLMFAHSLQTGAKGQPPQQTITIESVEIGADLGDDLFVMPEKSEAGTEEAGE